LLGSLLLAMLAFDANHIAGRGLRMHHHRQQDKIRLLDVVTIAMLVGLLASGRAYAQSSGNSSAPPDESSLVEPAAPPGVESLTTEPPETSAVSDDTATANTAEDSTVRSGSDDSDVVEAPPDSAADPNGTVDAGDASGSGSENGAVLEIPQVVNLQKDRAVDAQADEAAANEAAANREGDDDDAAAQTNQAGNNNADDDDLAAAGGQVGTLEDYQNQVNQGAPSVIFLGPGVAVVRFPPPPVFNPLPQFGVPTTSPIIPPPASGGRFPYTSPMLMAPRFGTFGSFPRVGPFPHFGSFHGGLIGAHR
jgi:hypothetical protein